MSTPWSAGAEFPRFRMNRELRSNQPGPCSRPQCACPFDPCEGGSRAATLRNADSPRFLNWTYAPEVAP
jgi:hypothetical protein